MRKKPNCAPSIRKGIRASQNFAEHDSNLGLSSVFSCKNIKSYGKLFGVFANNNELKKLKSVKSAKSYGEFSNVFLCDDEFEKLQERLGREKTLSYIERLSGYIASSGKKYKSHYATLLNWAQRDQNKSSGGENFAQSTKLCTEYSEGD